MKSLQINIIADNNDEGKFIANIDVNNLSREDATEFKQMIADDLEKHMELWLNKLAEVMKNYHPGTEIIITKV